jgi:hypothetical protein
MNEKENSPASGIYDIPGDYGIDTIAIMPVNANTAFIYWELTDRSAGSGMNSSDMVIKVFETEGDLPKEIHSSKVKERIGKRYINHHAPFNSLVVRIGVLKDGKFLELSKSRPRSIPFHMINKAEDEIWLKKTGGLTEVVRLPVSTGITPYDIAKKTELFKATFSSELIIK